MTPLPFTRSLPEIPEASAAAGATDAADAAGPAGALDTSGASGVAGLRLLAGPDAGELLAAALEPVGGQVLSWHADHVDHQPGRGCTAAYQVRIAWPDGRVGQERMAARTGHRLPAGALVLDNGATRVAVWRFPYDPQLPALPAAWDRAALARLLEDFGLGAGPVRLRVRAYRPGRRAVIEACGTQGRLFVKVVRPSRVEALHQRHRVLNDAGVPVPPSLGYTPEGLLVLQALPGRTLRQALRDGSSPPPSAQAVLALLDRLPPQLAQGPPRPSWCAKAPHYAAVLGAALPERADQVTELADRLATTSTGPVTAVHGDLYENQLLVSGGHIRGLLDVDTAGPGERLDDLACLLGHLSVLAQIDRSRAADVNRLGSAYLAVFERHVDPAELRRRTAAVVLSLATGPHRVQEPGWPTATGARLDLAARWLDGAAP
ncbi:phosphotransferase family protein [Streptomyces coeruleorubidus]|uniref:phosphotransferase family protein n=1 Tax=Streptomyces coeruleorubidus TaxID=116188 RepID=UPI0033E3C4FA